MTEINGLMVIHNESDRYLEACIRWNKQFVDHLFVYDDQSTDNSAEIALDLGCRVVVRPDSKPSFIEHEGRFRYSSWRAFEKIIQPEVGSWVLSIDADEFLVADKDITQILHKAVYKAKRDSCVGVILPFPEIFKIDNEDFYYRTDGFWNKIRGPRLFQYRSGASWKMKSMGCGSEPEYVSKGPLSNQNFGLTVLHLGYARDEDKQSKYSRYSSLAQHGHDNSHIESIIKTPTLEKWKGYIPVL